MKKFPLFNSNLLSKNSRLKIREIIDEMMEKYYEGKFSKGDQLKMMDRISMLSEWVFR